MLNQFFSYYKPYKKLFLIDFSCAILTAVIELFFPVLVNRVIDQVLPQGNLGKVLLISLALLVLYITNMILTYIVVTLGHRLGINIESDMRRDLFAYYQKQSFAYFDQHQTGELMSRITTDLFDISELAHHGPEDIFITIMTLVASFVMMLQIHVPLAIITVLMVPLLGIALSIFNKRMMKVNQQIFANLGQVSAGIQNAISGMRVVKAFANEDHEKERFEDLIQSYRQAKMGFYQTMGSSSAFNYILMRMITLFALLAGSYFTLQGQLTIGQMVAFILLANVFVRPIERINVMLELYPKGYAGFKRFQEAMSQPVTIVDRPDAIEASVVEGDIVFDQVSFAYQADKPVLSEINLHVKPGEKLAFVGPSGSGKTSLVNLIPRFYEVSQGRIMIDGHDIRDLTLHSLRKQIGIVQQDVFLFAGTIRENVAYGKLDASEEEIEAAIKAARLEEVVANLPQGLDTQIGERGVRLSGGQKQRLSIARIFLKNPKILILDEATSALDTQTEAYIQESLDQLAEGRTSLVIAHRLATIKHVDRIIVITKDGIIEDGSHDELMALDGLYAKLYQAQFNRKEFGIID